VPELARRAEGDLARLGYKNVHLRIGDGYLGWPELAPFDAIVVTAAPEKIPPPLLEQLKVAGVSSSGGRLFPGAQSRDAHRRRLPGEINGSVRFVPMTGRAQHERDGKP